MRIDALWAKGYRSLRDVRLEGLGAFNVFYGPNGAGKSNILAAIRTLIQLAAVAATGGALTAPDVKRARIAIQEGIVRREDLCAHDPSQVIVLGASFSGLEDLSPRLKLPKLDVEVTLDWVIEREPRLSISQLRTGKKKLDDLWRSSLLDSLDEDEDEEEGGSEDEDRDEDDALNIGHFRALLLESLPARAYGLVSADRSLRSEVLSPPPQGEDVIAWQLRHGRLKNALLAAHVSPSHEVRRRLGALRALLAGPPLFRPPFDPVQDPHTGAVDLRERLPEPNPEGRDLSIELAGLGIAQIYSILAQAMLQGARAIGIEEPEAHLHAPTSGRHLRQLLVRLVEEKYVDQLFIATHSNLFDLDPTGYFDVSLEEGCTVVKREELTRIDREHLYEPGPAKHALQRMLEYTPPEEVVFRRADDSPVTAQEMLRMLQEDDAVAVSFLQDVHGAAVRMVRVQSKKPRGA
ncbi:AAA family ATPase [Sorangium sp. So ce854]|uniref:AAA family ATPase n=1 Tax=Sorangium sp. So ce854 TaxID=3133322 RepID=UPI003F5DE9D0